VAGESEVDYLLGSKVRADRSVAGLAGRQHGVISRVQLLALGLSARAIMRRLERGHLHPLHRGVYAVGHRVLSARGRWMAAVLAAGPSAVLSHRSAAGLWDVRAVGVNRIEVTAPGERHRPGIDARRGRLSSDEVTEVDGIPVTTAARTLLDLAAVLRRPQLERAVERAEALRLADALSLDALLERHRGRQGTAALREMIGSGVEPALTHSELEDLLLAFLDAHGMPRPEVKVNVRLGNRFIEADFLWRAQRLIVELDGHETHGTRAAFERDRERDRILQTHGWRVIRITWRQLHETPDALAADLAALLTQP
jgi:very-short-patch-repair endonuclease/predicted transcriptional regulator of viral defense system